MARNKVDHGFVALKIEGGLFSGQFLQKAAALQGKHQNPADYNLPKGLNIKEEIGRAWRIALAEWRDYHEKRQRQDADVHRIGIDGWLQRLLQAVLGFDDLKRSKPSYLGSRRFPLSHFAVDDQVPLLLTTFDVDLDHGHADFGDEGRRRSPHALVQEYLNADENCLWGVVGNGNRIRLLRDNPSMTRPSYLEADLERMFEEELFPDFAAFWLLFHASRFQPADTAPETCPLEAWRHEAEEVGVRALSHLRDGVTQALRELGSGLLAHHANSDLRHAIASGEFRPEDFHQQLLRLVYRLIFLLTAEDREILFHPEASEEARSIYHSGYAIGLLRERSLKRHFYDQHGDLWQGLQVVFRALGTGADPLGLPALGGLFEAEQCEILDRGNLSNQALLKGIHALCFFRSGDTLARVNYRDMGVEELGSVYESLLELHPQIDIEARPWRFAFAGDEAEGTNGKGSERKLSGSYYTPPSLVNELIKSALEPVIEQTLAAHPDTPREALLKLKIIDPASGSGHFLLAAARRLAAELARIEAQTDQPDEMLYRHTLREVVQHCIFGVDRNPMAVELCKTALWLETIEPGKPLGFLDHHIRCGDSLIGVRDPQILHRGIPDEAYKPLTGDDSGVAKSLKKFNPKYGEKEEIGLFETTPFQEYSPVALNLDDMPEESLADIETKRAAWCKAQEADIACLKERLRCHLYVAAFFAPKTKKGGQSVPTNEDLNRLRQNLPPRETVARLAMELAEEHRFFHWHLAFPDVFSQGGFDVALGNPPWERIKLQEQEFFAQRSPSIAKAPNKAARERLIKKLESADASPAEKLLYGEFVAAKRAAEAGSEFIRKSGIFPLTGVGDVNTYALFAELFLNLLNEKGRAGFIVPTGIATDDSTKAYFEAISMGQRLVSLYDFENRQKLFPAVDSRMKFSLLTLGNAVPQADFSFFLTDTLQLKDQRRHFTLSREDICLLNPNTRTCPVFRSQVDAELTKKIYRNASVLIDESKGEAGNPWGVRFMAMFHMSNDSGSFRTCEQLENAGATRQGNCWIDADGRTWLPLYEAKMVHQYDHRWASYEADGTTSRDVTEEEKKDPGYEPLPRYWVKERVVQDQLHGRWEKGWLLGFRDITNATNERTVINSIAPSVGFGNNMPIMLLNQQIPPGFVAGLVGNLSSIIFDFIARHKVGGTHLNFFIAKQLPVLPAREFEGDGFIAPRILELTYTSESLRPWAEDLGYQGAPFPWDPERRALLRAELDAYYAKLYSLTLDELRYILDPSDVYGEDYPSETFRVLKEKEMRQYGEYRTRRLVLKAWARLERGEL